MFHAWLRRAVKTSFLLNQRGRRKIRSVRAPFRPQLMALEERCLLDAFNEFALAGNSHPHGITAGPDGNLWFTQYNGNQIGRITPAGSVTEFPPLPTSDSYPNRITAGPGDQHRSSLWFTELGTNKIGRITRDGAVTEFSLPTNHEAFGITVGPDGNLWFTEYGGNRI